ncbi:MAG: hypothetical protein DRR42_04185 [Gammaproteobacteria bacterium]|nr:MAG: hypothetical protein DRR42_04185 [Gammaproteobacteria bacterium]
MGVLALLPHWLPPIQAGNTLTVGENILSSARVVILFAVMLIFIVAVQTWLNFFSDKRRALHLQIWFLNNQGA